MSDNVYEPPNSGLVDKAPVTEKLIPYKGGYNSAMKIAVLVLVALQMLPTVSRIVVTAGLGYSLVSAVISFIFSLLHILIIVFLIAKLRKVKISLGSDGKERDVIGVWGYIWRYYISVFGAFAMSAVLLVFTGMLDRESTYSIPVIVFMGIAIIPFSICVVWLLFSRDRQAQYLWILGIIRGF